MQDLSQEVSNSPSTHSSNSNAVRVHFSEPDTTWKTMVVKAVRTRNLVEKERFEPVFLAYQRALTEVISLRNRNFQIEQQLGRRDSWRTSSSAGPSVAGFFSGTSSASLSLTDEGGGGGDGGRKMLEEKIAKLQEELLQSHRLNAENAQALNRMRERSEQDEKAVLKKDEQVQIATAKVRDAEERSQEDAMRISALKETVDLLHAELQATKKRADLYETKTTQLTKENQTLVERIMRIKDDQAESMNEMAALVAAAKEKGSLGVLGSGGVAGGEGVGKDGETKEIARSSIDLSADKNSILDAVAWRSYFNVTLPKGHSKIIPAHSGQATSVAYNAAGTLLVTGGVDTLIKIWDAQKGKPLATLSSSKQSIMNVCFSEDDSYILSAGNDKVARVWAMKTSRILHTLTGHNNKIYAAGFVRSGEYALTGSHDMTVRIWEMQKGTCTKTINCRSSCNSLGIAPYGNILATAHMDATIKLWSVETGEPMHSFEGLHESQVTCCEFSADGTLIISNSRDHKLKLLDVRTNKVIKEFTGTHADPYKNCVNWGRACFSPDGKYIVAGSSADTLMIWDVSTAKVAARLVANKSGVHAGSHASEPSFLCSVDWNRNGKQVASVDDMGSLVFWEEGKSS